MKVLNRKYFNPNDGHLRSMNLLYGRVVNLKNGINQGYWVYMNDVNVHQRINNRSWFVNFFDGAMNLTLKYKRRHGIKDYHFDHRPKKGISKSRNELWS